MANQNREERTQELLMLVMARSASDEERNELNELLRGDDQLRRIVVDSLSIDAMILNQFRIRESPDAADTEEGRRAAALGLNEVEPPVPYRGALLVAALVSATVIFVIASLLFEGSSNEGQESENRLEARFEGGSSSRSSDGLAIGAITFTLNAKWHPSKTLGDVIKKEELHLTEGVGRIHLSNGVVLVADATTQPVKMRFREDDALVVMQGRLIADVPEEELGFTVLTPTAHVVDIGTRFGVAVDANGSAQDASRITVYEGTVSCRSLAKLSPRNPNEMLLGNAFEFQSGSLNPGMQIQPDEASDRAETILDKIELHERDSDLWLHACEKFQIPVGDPGRSDLGIGWDGPWFRADPRVRNAVAVVRSGEFLSSLPWLNRDDKKYLVVPSASICSRAFSDPISLDQNRDVFVSFFVRRRSVASADEWSATKNPTSVGVGFRGSDSLSAKPAELTHNNLKFLFSLGKDELIAVESRGKQGAPGGKGAAGKTHFVVIQLGIRSDEPDFIRAKLFSENDTPQVVAPENWNCTAKSINHSGYLRTVNLWSNENAIAAFDDLRIGDSWQSVIPIRN